MKKNEKKEILALIFTMAEDGSVIVKAKVLNDKIDDEKEYELLNLVFEHIS